jgi:SAM-dependent methyltransferase
MQSASSAEFGFVCPLCKGELVANPSSYHCDRCAITYPILFGIPDFRLRSDPYLSLEDERAKARRLFEFGQSASIEEVVRFYYSLSDDLPRNIALRYQAAIRAAPERARHIIGDLAPKPDLDILLDLGCGTGGLLVSAQGHYRAIYGVDIALRWLVVCQKRLRERKATATLVCADVEALPFPHGSFTQAVAVDLMEHVYNIDSAAQEIERTLRPGALLWLSANNRYCLGPHPLTGVWAIGFLPDRPRAWILKKLKGIDLLRYANMVSARDLGARMTKRGFAVLKVKPRHIDRDVATGYGALDRGLIALYRLALNVPILRGMLVRIGPAFEVICRKGSSANGR